MLIEEEGRVEVRSRKKMKGGGGNQGKRRWRCLAMGVLFLVLLSMLVPLVFLLGLYNGFLSDHSSTPSTSTDQSRHVDRLLKRLGPLPKEVGNVPKEVNNVTTVVDLTSDHQLQRVTPAQTPHEVLPLPRKNDSGRSGVIEVANHTKGSVEGSEKNCELMFGSYCLWREENREDMKDSMVKKLKDQLFVARAYYPSIAKLPSQSKLSRELRQNIQDLERVLSESTTDADLPPLIEKKLMKTRDAVAKAKVLTLDCNNVDKKLRQILDLTEDEANFHMKQSAFLYQLAVQTMPKSFHCMSMRLTVEFFKSSLKDLEPSLSEKFSDPTLHHYILVSNNVLASSVVINSTIFHAKESRNMVFHVLTDEQNYYAMKLWYIRNIYREAAVEVLNIEHFNLDHHDKAAQFSVSLPVEFRVSFHSADNAPDNNLRTDYISVFSHTHYLLPSIFPNLKRVVVLDDDVVVKRDLSDLWNLNMGGKVNGALQLCSVWLGQLNRYLAGNILNQSSCAWMSGLNVIDLVRWRELDLTKTYSKLSQVVMKGEGSNILAANLLTFQDLVYVLDSTWILSGLGHDYGLDVQVIKNAAVLHYNGKMKPWLELGIPRYKHYWKRFLNREDQILCECNVNP